MKKSGRKVIELLDSREKEWNWIEQRREELKEQYDQKLIAVKGGKVVAAAARIEEILKKLRRQGIDPSETVVEYISKMPVMW